MRGLGRMFFYLTNGASGLWSLKLLKNTKKLPAYHRNTTAVPVARQLPAIGPEAPPPYLGSSQLIALSPVPALP